MRDMSCNLPTWAYQLGYRLKGDMGTYGFLYLSKGDRTVREFRFGQDPNIFEIGDIINELEDQEARWPGEVAY